MQGHKMTARGEPQAAGYVCPHRECGTGESVDGGKEPRRNAGSTALTGARAMKSLFPVSAGN